jgi:general secretion pathway protein N
LALVLGALACCHPQNSARAATGDAAIEPTTTSPPMGDPTSRPDKPAVRVLTGNPLWAIPLRSLSTTRERPLFSPSRRPPAPAVVAAPSVPLPEPPPKAAEPDHPLLTLVGTIVGETGGLGIFVDQATGAVIRLKTGQDHAGWTLRAVQGREATFEKGAREATLALPARSDAAQASSAPVPLSVQGGGTWMDGDGRLISPPQSLTLAADGGKAGAPASAWMDGDGQIISPPPGQIRKSAQQ